MRAILPLRFESIQTLRETANLSTFLATDHLLHRNNVVIKAFRKGHFTQDTARLADTFAWYRGLRHRHVAEILDGGLTPRGDLFLVRDFAPSTQLFSTRDTELLNALLSTVEFIHSMGHVHGAIKPSNVLAASKSIQLADPWILQAAKNVPSEEDVRFSAPEVLRGGARTIESDLYSVGALLYRFYSGRDLFDDADLESLTARHVWASPRPLTSISYVSRTIADIVEGLIHKDPAQRPLAFEALKGELHLRSVAAFQAPVFGMSPALSAAEAFLTGANDRLRVITVEGPAGFGKTRFIDELQHRVSLVAPNLGFSVCPNHGHPPDVTMAQWFLSVFDRYCSSFEDPSVKRLRARIDDAESSAGYSFDNVVHDLVDVLTSITRKVPTTLVVEDLDRTNRKLAPLIDAIVSRAARLRLCLVVTSRTGGIARKRLQTFTTYTGAALQQISLRHLRPEDIQSIAAFLETDGDRRAAACKASGGIPLFLEEYCRNQKPGMPSQVRKSVSRSISSLPRESKYVAEVLSLFEEPVSLELLHKVSGLGTENLKKPLSDLRSLGLTDDRIAICHSDTRTLLYSKIPKHRRTGLHALSYHHLKDSEIDKTSLAFHAYNGALFDIAGSLFLELARDAPQARGLSLSARLYGLAHNCRKRSAAVPPACIDETIAIARSRGYLGDSRSARTSLRRLLSKPEVREDPEALSAVYSALASAFVEPSHNDRIRLLTRAVESLAPSSQTLAHRKRSLVQALLNVGRVEEAERILVDLHPERNDDGSSGEYIALRSMLLAARGRFGEAIKALRENGFQGYVPAAAKTNVAFYLEQLGEIREASKIQHEAVAEAESPVIQIQCLRNLGSMETKLGNLSLAQNFFEKALTRAQQIREAKDSAFLINDCYSDLALHWIERGSYRKAILYIDRSHPPTDKGNHWETFQFYLPQCELLLALGELNAVPKVLDQTRGAGSVGGFLDNERLLIQYRLQRPTHTGCDAIQQAVLTSRQIGTTYQECRLLLALSSHLLLLGDVPLAKAKAIEALELAQQKGFRVLAAHAHLRRGLTAETEAQKQSDFVRCLQEASDMGLIPLLFECAFQVGLWRYANGDYASARDYFFRSVSLASRMAEDLDSARRKKYFLLPLNQEAKRLLNEATIRTKEFTSFLKEPLGREDLLVGGLYRLTSSLASTKDTVSILQLLARCLRQGISHWGVVVAESEKQLTIEPLEEHMPEEVKQEAAIACRKGGEKFYFIGLGKKHGRSSAAWVPIPSLAQRSGIYVECKTGEALDEQEIQYLIISASITGAALDRIASQVSPRLALPPAFSGIVGISKSVLKVHADIEVAARNSATVLIEGESGTGKELVAKAIHSRSLRANAPFVPIDCGALPDGLIESELFGTRKGSFTGADRDRHGLFEEADHGTVFLDEVANASPLLQAKLLRVLQEREIRRIGDGKGTSIDVRLLAATNRNLDRLVREGLFRQDLLFRLKVLHIHMPPLRERMEDIPILARAFLDRLNIANHTRKTFGLEFLTRLSNHDFPGNVRELQNTVERAFYSSNDDSLKQVLDDSIVSAASSSEEPQRWLEQLANGQCNFWSAVRDRYKRREISRDRVLALLDLGLRATKGNYKAIASLFKIKDTEYGRFMDFLRRNGCLLDFRPYR
jgi:DNA-binding NtrC family response regulator/tetratricopeptide (TPR) repeat protein